MNSQVKWELMKKGIELGVFSMVCYLVFSPWIYVSIITNMYFLYIPLIGSLIITFAMGGIIETKEALKIAKTEKRGQWK